MLSLPNTPSGLFTILHPQRLAEYLAAWTNFLSFLAKWVDWVTTLGGVRCYSWKVLHTPLVRTIVLGLKPLYTYPPFDLSLQHLILF